MESGFKTLDVKTLDIFLHRNCTTMNYAPIILKSHNSQTKNRLKHDAIPTLFDVTNPPKIIQSWPLKMRKPVAKKKVKTNNVECECRFLILFDDNCVVELCSEISKTESNFSISTSFCQTT